MAGLEDVVKQSSKNCAGLRSRAMINAFCPLDAVRLIKAMYGYWGAASLLTGPSKVQTPKCKEQIMGSICRGGGRGGDVWLRQNAEMLGRVLASGIQFQCLCNRFLTSCCFCTCLRCSFLPCTPCSCLCSQDTLLQGKGFYFEDCSVVVLDTCMIQEMHLCNLMSPTRICIHVLSRDVWS